MWGEILVAVAGLIGSAMAGLGGFKLIAYRLDKVESKVEKVDQKVEKIDERESQIEKKVDIIDQKQNAMEQKVDKHNNVIERTFILEEKQKVNEHRLEDLERHEEQRMTRVK